MKSSMAGWHVGTMALILGLAARAETIYVSLQGSESNTGKGGWANAVASISNGVARAANYDTVLVSNGTYVLSAQVTISKTGLKLVGYAGRDMTILNGNYPTTVNRCVVLAADNVILDGLTFSNGCTTAGNSGGAVAANTVNGLVVRNCTFVNNRSDLTGGGMSLPHGIVSNCVFKTNYAKHQGGGLKHANYGPFGMTSRLTDCRFVGNTLGAEQYGAAHGGGGAGAMVGSLDVVNCVIVSNSSPYAKYGRGGGLFKVGSGAVRNCLIYGNDSFYGGGIYSTDTAIDAIDNCTIANNKAYIAGGAYFLVSGSTMRNSIVISNTASTTYPNYYNDTQVETTFINCNAAPLIVPGPYGAGTNSPACAGNINADPRFAAAESGDFRLMPRSPCLNTGTNQTWMTGARDLYGNPRLDKSYARVDIGCHEYVFRNGTILTLR